MIRKPCLGCGIPVEGSRCMDCAAEQDRATPRPPRGRNSRRDGYTTSWEIVSRKARRMQPWCTDCGREENLHADHLPSAWDRYHQGLTIQLVDVEVVCSACNNDRGSSRPGSERWDHWVKSGRPRGEGVLSPAPEPDSPVGEPVSVENRSHLRVGGGSW